MRNVHGPVFHRRTYRVGNCIREDDELLDFEDSEHEEEERRGGNEGMDNGL